MHAADQGTTRREHDLLTPRPGERHLLTPALRLPASSCEKITSYEATICGPSKIAQSPLDGPPTHTPPQLPSAWRGCPGSTLPTGEPGGCSPLCKAQSHSPRPWLARPACPMVGHHLRSVTRGLWGPRSSGGRAVGEQCLNHDCA